MITQGQTTTSAGPSTFGSATNVLATPAGEMRTLDVSNEATVRELLSILIGEVRRLRLGLIAAPDSVCIDIEGEATPVTSSEE